MVLVPKNENKKIKSIDEAIDNRFKLLNEFDLVLFPKTCKKELLPHLAFLFDVDINFLEEDEARKLLNKAITLKIYAGSVYALRTALKAIVNRVKVIEWFDYEGKPYHFKVEIDSTTKEITKELVQKLNLQIKHTKNVRSTLDELSLSYIQQHTVGFTSGGVGEVFINSKMLEGYETRTISVQNISIGAVGETSSYAIMEV